MLRVRFIYVKKQMFYRLLFLLDNIKQEQEHSHNDFVKRAFTWGFNEIKILKLSIYFFKQNLFLQISKRSDEGFGIPELENRVKKLSYALWRHKTELTQIVTSS